MRYKTQEILEGEWGLGLKRRRLEADLPVSENIHELEERAEKAEQGLRKTASYP